MFASGLDIGNGGRLWYLVERGGVKRTFWVVCRVSRLVKVSRNFSSVEMCWLAVESAIGKRVLVVARA